MTEGRFQVRETPIARAYLYPINRVLLTATTEGAAQTLVTIRDDSLGELEGLAVSNQTGSAASLTFYAVPDGEVIGAGNREITAKSIPANDNVDLLGLVQGLYAPKTALMAFASTGSALMVMGKIRGVL